MTSVQRIVHRGSSIRAVGPESRLDKAEKRKFDQVSAQVIGSDFEGFAINRRELGNTWEICNELHNSLQRASHRNVKHAADYGST